MNKFFLAIVAALFLGYAFGLRIRTNTQVEKDAPLTCNDPAEARAGANAITLKMVETYNKSKRTASDGLCTWDYQEGSTLYTGSIDLKYGVGEFEATSGGNTKKYQITDGEIKA
jgi:hypothetical protein